VAAIGTRDQDRACRSDLAPDRRHYDYCDEAEVVLFQVCRFGPKKTFAQRAPDGDGGWRVGPDGFRGSKGAISFFSITAKQLTTADNAEPKDNRRLEPTPISGFSQGKRYLDAAIKKTRAAGSDENWLKARADGLLAPARS
jgi:hypothetical protein